MRPVPMGILGVITNVQAVMQVVPVINRVLLCPVMKQTVKLTRSRVRKPRKMKMTAKKHIIRIA